MLSSDRASDSALVCAAAVVSASCQTSEDAISDAAANVIINSWHEHKVHVRAQMLLELHAAREAKADSETQLLEERDAREFEQARRRCQLQGVLRRVWPVVREVLAAMSAAVALVVFTPVAFDALPGPFDVDPNAPVISQMWAALAGAGVAVLAFTVLFLLLLLFYMLHWTVALHGLHSMWIGGLIGGPFGLLLLRLCGRWRIPLDAATCVVLVWNVTVPGVVLVHWSATTIRFAGARRLYAAALSVLCGWLLASVPYTTALCALLMLALLDVLLVSFPGSPVQKLDAVVQERRRAGEPEMPGLTFKRHGLELGLGDFIVYSAFAAHAANAGVAPLAASSVGVLSGLTITMAHVALARQRTVVPALPLSVALGAGMLAVERGALRLFATALARAAVVL